MRSSSFSSALLLLPFVFRLRFHLLPHTFNTIFTFVIHILILPSATSLCSPFFPPCFLPSLFSPHFFPPHFFSFNFFFTHFVKARPAQRTGRRNLLWPSHFHASFSCLWTSESRDQWLEATFLPVFFAYLVTWSFVRLFDFYIADFSCVVILGAFLFDVYFLLYFYSIYRGK